MIHKYKLNGYNMVLDVNSDAVHVFDDCSYDILDFIDSKNCDLNNLTDEKMKDIEQSFKSLSSKYPLETIKECYSEIVKLVENGVLFSPDIDYKQVAEKATSNTHIKSMCLNVAHDCNLRCEYCFAAKGNFGGEAMLMPFEIGKKAIDFLIQNSGNIRNLEVDFFGGEPLMNFDVVKKIVEYARSIEKEHNKNFRFTITTNGILLTDDKIEYINKEMSNCVLSIDGRKEVNDRLRVRADGTGSYYTILPKFKKLVETRGDKDYYVRGTFTKYNLDFANDVIHFADLGFDQISIEPVVSDPKLEYSIKEEDLPAVFDEYERLAKIIIDRKKEGRGFNFFHFMIDLDNGPCVVKRFKGCGCGNEYVAVTPNGEIYPCHQFVGQKNWKIGDLNTGDFSKEMKFYFSQANMLNKSDCKNCFAKFYCSGGCNANNFNYEGSVFQSHKLSCELQRKRLECSLMIKAALAE